MKKLPDQAYPIPDETLTAVIEALRDYALRLEVEAAGLVWLHSGQAHSLGQKRLEEAESVRRLVEYFVNL